jgi:hypothetical protein
MLHHYYATGIKNIREGEWEVEISKQNPEVYSVIFEILCYSRMRIRLQRF